MSGNLPTATNDPDPTHCPLCNAPVSGSDGLQLHYLTNCSGYDKLSNEQPRPKLAKVTRDDPPVTMSNSRANTFGASSSATPSGARVGGTTASGFSGATATGGGVVSGPSGSSTVQFMWQPLTEITYPEITLLASFEPGSVSLTLDPDGGHYASRHVSIPNGAYEGQLVIGDSFVYPVKKFTVSTKDDIVILQFDVKAMDESEGKAGYSSTTSSHYGTGHMQQNPSYSGQYVATHSYPRDSMAGHSGGASALGQGAYQSRGASTGISNRPGGIDDTFSYYKDYQSNAVSQSHTQPLSTHHATPTSASSHTPLPQSRDYSRTSEATNRSQSSVSSKNSKATPSTRLPDNFSSSSTVSRQPQTNERPGKSRVNVSPTPPQSSTRHTTRPAAVGQASASGNRGDLNTEFNVGQLQQQTDLDQITDIHVLRRMFEAVTKERDSVKQNQERVNARWDGKVKRLEAQLARARGENPPTEENNLEDALQEAQDVITRLERELDSMKRQQTETSPAVRGNVELERELSEMKDRNTALEQQLVEYAGTISDQTKYIQSSVAGTKAQDAEALKSQQDLIHITAFAKKQQLEQAEALASLNKKINSTSTSIQSFRDVELENVQLAGEIEDYRKQTKRFLEDQKQKEEEIGRLREALSKRGPQSSDQLEVATLQEKLTAWQEEFEKLAPLRDEVEELRELNEHQNEQIQRLASDNEDLTRQIQSVIDNGGKRDSELHRKVNDYDTLMERFIELQQTRVSLENELQPLREERAKTLRENAHLREGSIPQNYAKLKVEFEGLTAHAKRLEDHLSEKNALLSVHQHTNVEMQTKLDQATDPERLNSIRLRMERYKQERDASRKHIDELTEQLAIAEAGRQDTLEELREATEQSERCIGEFQHKITEQDQVIDRLRLYEEKMRNYREERNKARKRCKELEGQVSSWRDLVHKKHDSEVPAAPSNYDDEYEHSYSPSHRDQLASPQSDYHPQAYSGEQHVHRRESLESPLSEQDRGLALETSKPPQPRKRTTSGSHSGRGKGKVKQDSLFEMVDVKTKDGTTVMTIGKPHGGLSAKTRPKVIVKRGDSYEQGILMYVGDINDKEMAGIQMDCRLQKPTSSSNTNQDGTYKDGRMYFKCPIGFSLYVPSSKVYLQMDSAYV